jgi:hypothetical protein
MFRKRQDTTPLPLECGAGRERGIVDEAKNKTTNKKTHSTAIS